MNGTRLCSSKWTRGGRGATDKVYQCDVGNFGFATRVANPAGIIKISGGVVIMVRKGLTISDLHEEAYEDHDFEDGMSQKGFLRARVHHPSIGEVWVIGSHTQAWPENEEIRVKQWRQLWRHIQTTIPEGARVVVAGDMNTEMSEISVMKTELHAASPPLQPAGFWLPLRETLKYSSYGGGGQNAYLHYDPKEVHEKSPHDQIAYISNDGKYASPQTMKWQYLPMKSDVCFSSSLTRPNISVDDLSDHYAAYAELCYGSRCESQELSGHRGYSRIGFMEAPRCCPGRGMIYGKCFDWAPGGIHAGDIGLSESQRCTKISKKCETKVQASSVEECLRMLAEMDLPFDQIECN
ncbi:unnamed protein product [Symbiodinium natans]|uniref:Endonuclease/exonuclease/phosphatase domain-containing protein n=1 Tax=Symbiodinium natans TaxID=878477 RepID=A0A812RCN0_9DINO|nr:unnamed protein product [Symbiodinium natans]